MSDKAIDFHKVFEPSNVKTIDSKKREKSAPDDYYKFFKTFNSKLTADGKRQQCASDAMLQDKRRKVFSRETDSVYEYLVCTPDKFWKNYRTLLETDDLSEALYHEMIREGRPCRLYLDLEYAKADNLHISDGVPLTLAFIGFICIELERPYDFVCNPATDVIQLDASTATKFSRHVIFHLKDDKGRVKYFENNFAAGNFVKHCVAFLKHLKEADAQELASLGLSDFFVRKEISSQSSAKCYETASFCDEAVYSKNRNFRIYKSCKFGKNNPFLLAKDCQFYKERHPVDDKTVFYDTLVECMDENVAPEDLLKFMKESLDKRKHKSAISRPGFQQRHHDESCRDKDDSIEICDNFCPCIDRQVLKFVRQNKADAVITKRNYKPSIKTLLYNFYDYKYCYAICRNHKSHSAFVVVRLGDKPTFYQKCYDIECKNHQYRIYPLNVHEDVQLEIRKLKDRAVSDVNKNFLDDSLPDEIALKVNVDAVDLYENFSNLNISAATNDFNE